MSAMRVSVRSELLLPASCDSFALQTQDTLDDVQERPVTWGQFLLGFVMISFQMQTLSHSDKLSIGFPHKPALVVLGLGLGLG